MTKFYALFMLAFVLPFIGCTTDTPTDSDNNSGNFTPPTTVFYKIDGISSSPSADKVYAGGGSGTIRVTKAFMLDGAPHNAELLINMGSTFSYRDSIKEGEVKMMHISLLNSTRNHDSLMLFVTMDYLPTGVYPLQASSGKLYLSKVNDTVQVSSNGPITVTGNNTQPPYESQTRTVEFHLRNQRSF